MTEATTTAATTTTTLKIAVGAAILLMISLSPITKNNKININITKEDDENVLFALSSSSSLASSSSVPLPKPYPSAFQISFVTNITRKEDDDDKQQQQQQQYPISGQLYYDSSIPAQRVDHDTGSFECVHFYQHNQPCSLYFLGNEGMYRILHYNNNTKAANLNNSSSGKMSGDKDDEIDCCLDLKGIGPPPRDWARRGNPTYAGTVIDEFSGVPAQEWVFHPSSDNDNNNNNASLENNMMDESSWWWYNYFNYRKQKINKYHHQQQQQSMIRRQTKEGGQRTAVVSSTSSSSSSPADTYHTSRQALFPPNEGTPLLFTFPGSAPHGTQDYHYLMETMIIQDKIDPNKFHIPSSCHNRLCDSDSDSNNNNEYRIQ